MRSNYWSCSKFADKIRGTAKPYALDGDGWHQWKKEAKASHKIRYWMAETGLSKLQNFVMWPVDKLYSIKYYVVNRWVDQSNALVAHKKNIKPGQYMDLDGKIFYCLFDELVDFVEIEKAYNNFRWSEEKSKSLKWWQGGIWRTRTWRNPEAGIEHLKWEMALTDEEWLDEDKKHLAKPTDQARVAGEILELYTWYTEFYPKRECAMDLSGWSEYCRYLEKKEIPFLSNNRYDEVYPNERVTAIHKRNNEIDQSYEQEDTEMLIRLIKIRKSLWS
jgi:hypothetical protein